MPRIDVLGEEAFAPLLDLDLGDLLGVHGAVFSPRRGTLPPRWTGFELLAKSCAAAEKHDGLADVETRHRQREIDLISSEETRDGSSRARR